jgi:hypothetical protein
MTFNIDSQYISTSPCCEFHPTLIQTGFRRVFVQTPVGSGGA